MKFSLTTTKSFVSYTGEKIFFGWYSFLLWGMVLIFIVISALITQLLLFYSLIAGILLYIYYSIYTIIYSVLRDNHSVILDKSNYAEYLDYDLAEKLIGYLVRKNLSVSDILASAARTKRGGFLLSAIGYTTQEFIDKSGILISSDIPVDIDSLWKQIFSIYEKWEESTIGGHTVLMAFFSLYPQMKSLLDDKDISEVALNSVLEWEALSHNQDRMSSVPVFSPEWIEQNFESVGRFWNLGYTNDLDRITSEITPSSVQKRAIIHSDIIQSISRVLQQSTKKNVLLLGSDGVGKSHVVHNFANLLYQYQIKNNKSITRVLLLETNALLSGTSNAMEYLYSALAYAERSGNIILIIENISEILSTAPDQIRSILSQFLESPSMRIIAIDYPDAYHTSIKTFPILHSQFEVIQVNDASDEESMRVLMDISLYYKKTQSITITYQSLDAIIQLSKRYLSQGGMPGKAVEVLQESIQMSIDNNSSFVLESDVRIVLSRKAKVNVQSINDHDKNILLSLESVLSDRIIGQSHAIKSLVNALKRSQLALNSDKKPIGTFLLLGPTGVGKTETAKALAESYFGSRDRMIRIDMNDFADPDSIFGIIGTPVGTQQVQYQESFLAKSVQDRPFSLVLLDEIEKAHPTILNVFLQVLDEGFLTDSRGIRTDFRNTIILATSNAGADFVRSFIQTNPSFDGATFKQELITTLLESQQFSPEFMNRFSEILVYYPLSNSHINTIARNMITELFLRIEQEKGVTLRIDTQAIQYLGTKGYSLDFGVRELERTITDVLETYIANYFLTHSVMRGDEIFITEAELTRNMS